MKTSTDQVSKEKRLTFRERLFPLGWKLLLPIRIYLKFFPLQRGKGLLLDYIIKPMLPNSEAGFELELPGGGVITLRYRETLGLSSLLYGTFEYAELEFVRKHLRPGQTVLDIGANVGIFSIVMGTSLEESGRVFAFEPSPANIARLRNNLSLNGLENVIVFEHALGEETGQMTLMLATDPAYASLMEVQSGLGDGSGVPVDVQRLDDIWDESGRPDISFIKMDVEGAEPSVIRGAKNLIETCQPMLLVEANSLEDLKILCDLLLPCGYEFEQPNGFTIHNYLFRHLSAVKN